MYIDDVEGRNDRWFVVELAAVWFTNANARIYRVYYIAVRVAQVFWLDANSLSMNGGCVSTQV